MVRRQVSFVWEMVDGCGGCHVTRRSHLLHPKNEWMDEMSLVDLLIKHEGIKLKPYLCSAGRMTIGVGRNIEDVGITEEEAFYLLENDIKRCIREAKTFSWFDGLSVVRQNVILSMIFNMGLKRFSQFKRMIALIEKEDFEGVSHEMLSSVWASQVKKRAVELANMMKEGK